MPNEDNSWLDPRTMLALGGLAVGVLGLLFGMFRDRWSRRETRLDAIGNLLQPLVRAAQDLMKANICRRKCEQLKHSFPERTEEAEEISPESRFPKRPPEVVARVNSMVEEYGQLMESSEKHFRDAESEFATRYFRFPARIAKQVKELKELLSEMGRLVNEGLFDKADLQLAEFRGQYHRIVDTAKGWRLADPFEGILRHIRKHKPTEESQASEFELSQREMDGVLELLHKRVTTQSQNTFAVHPPQKVLNDRSILEADNVVEELKESVFSAVFQDGTAKMLSLPELMAFTFNLITYAAQTEELNRMVDAANPVGPREYRLTSQFSMEQIMTPEMVKVLLSKIAFSDTPSDE